MFFHLTCFSFKYEGDDDNFYTAFPDFDGSTPSSQNVSYMSSGSIMSVVSSLDLRPRTLRSFTLAELNEATKNFDPSSDIGEGGFGSVHLGTVKSSEDPNKDISVAVKRGKKGSQEHKQWVAEVNVLGEVQHPNLVKLIGYCAENNGNESNRILVYEYMPNRSLDSHLHAESGTPLTWGRRLKIALDAASCLTYLHQHQIIFRDFKPSNILLDDRWNAKLSDFGLARLGPLEGSTHVSTAVVGTKGYGAPEYAQTGRLTYKSDIWSYGVFLQELITGTRPLPQNNPNNGPGQLGWIKCCYAGQQNSTLTVDLRLEGQYSENAVRELSLIAKKCLAKDPKSRPKMSEILRMVKNVMTLEDKQIPNDGHT